MLEQRIARIYRLGQDRPVQILNLVSKNSIEEGMIAKLRFKSSMFEGVLDGGDDTVFVSDDKFKKFMEDLSCVMDDTPEPPVVEYVDDETEEKTADTHNNETEGQTADNADHEEIKEMSTEPAETKTATATPSDEGSEEPDTQTNPPANRHADATKTQSPKQLISQGVSFLTGLAETLKSEEATRQLVDNIVEVDEKTGEVNVKIPVASKQTVMQLFSLLGKLM